MYLMLSGDVINDDEKSGMGEFFATCFDPASVRFSIWNDRLTDDDNNKFNDPFVTLKQDATKCYMKYKFAKQLENGEMKCEETSKDSDRFDEILDSETPYCTVKK